jgi:branched-chain amino acid transport system ATP-binding protein
VSRGSIQWDGQNIDRENPEEIAKMGIIQVMEGRRILEHLTVEDELMAGGYIVRHRYNLHKELERVYHYFPKLKTLRAKTSGYLSGGAADGRHGQALMSHPKLVLLMSPPWGWRRCWWKFSIVRAINQEKTLILIVSKCRGILDLAEYGYVENDGWS